LILGCGTTVLLLLLLQLAEAQQQLSALSRHVEAVMVGYAVQALQAGSKAKKAAIHQQALQEQQQVRTWCLCFLCFCSMSVLDTVGL
jgi:hypothetical protein